mmetsp:Transcript_17120/g.54684  ORF Transcript_17120/g.54684 Transcript_17120/m.54684 type:complete len:312 (-) Transcript_17120:936-1871(-)
MPMPISWFALAPHPARPDATRSLCRQGGRAGCPSPSIPRSQQQAARPPTRPLPPRARVMGLALPGPSSVVVAASIIIAALLAAPVARGHTQPPEGWQPEKPPVSADYMRDFFKPVESPVEITAVPHALRNLVRLATNLVGAPETKEPDLMLNPSVANAISKEGGKPEPKKNAKIYADDFDPVKHTQWEQVVGGGVTAECGSMWGNAMCFSAEGSRYASTVAFNTIAGGYVRFSLLLAGEGGIPGDVVLEHKAAGEAWAPLEHYAADTYASAGEQNPNEASVVHVAPATNADGFFATFGGARSTPPYGYWRC